jgi:hypothetical protein
MSRNAILVLGVICWTGAAADAIFHLVSGDVLVPAVMLIAFAAWVLARQYHYSRVPART